jgi:hypothetical protein
MESAVVVGEEGDQVELRGGGETFPTEEAGERQGRRASFHGCQGGPFVYLYLIIIIISNFCC